MNIYLGWLYKEVEYIQSSWTQRIDTWINVSNDSTYWFELKCNFDVARESVMDMGWDNSDVRRYWVQVGIWNWQISRPMYGTNDDYANFVYNPTPQTWVDYTMVYNYNWNRSWSLNWTTYASNLSVGSFTYNYNWNIFCQTLNNWTYARFSKFKLYYMKIYHGTTLVRDFVPCYRLSDNVIWLFDKVNNKFYANAWTGTFTKGNDVKTFQAEVKNIYIGEYGWKPLNPKCWYKFDWDYTDATGTYWVASWTSTFQTLSSGVKVLQTNGSNTVNLPWGVTSSSLTTWTIAFWCKPLATGYFAGCNGDNYYYDLSFYMSTAGRCYAEWSGGISSHAIATIDKTDSSLSNNWRLFILKSDWTKVYMNINGSAFDEVTPNNTSIFRTGYQFAIGWRSHWVQMCQVLMSNFVISNTYWDDATCLDMYNKTKSNYWL